MFCPNCGQPAQAGSAFCTFCGRRMEGVPLPVAAPTGVPGAPAYYGTVARPSFYTPIPDILTLLADILVIVGFFLPWLVLIGIEEFSPLSMITGSNTAWWLWVIPIAMAAGCLVDFIISLVRILGTGRKLWRKYSYFSNMGGLVVAGVGWWILLLYVPTYSPELGLFSFSDLMRQGLSISMGIGLIFLFVAAGIQLLAGILAYSLSANR